MDKHGPMEINDERLFGQLAILPDKLQLLIQNFGGLEKFLLSSMAFVKCKGLICLAEFAAVVAASMNISEDMSAPSLDSNNVRCNSREEDLQEINKAYRLKKKGFGNINKDPILRAGKPSNTKNSDTHSNKPLHFRSGSSGNRNEMRIKKNSQETLQQNIHTLTPPPGSASNSQLGKPPHLNRSSHTQSINSNYSNSRKNKNEKESLGSVNSGLDPIDNSITFSSTFSGLSNSTRTEHSQEGPIGDPLIVNPFEYNAFDAGSRGNNMPLNEGFFPNACPQEQIESNSLLSEMSMPTVESSVTSKPGFSRNFSGSVLESAINVSNTTDLPNNMKILKSSVDMKTNVPASYGVNATTNSNNTYSTSVHHMEPVYLPPPPPIQQPTVTVDKKDACVETDEAYVYYENYKEKYEAAMKSQCEVLRRLQESEDCRVQMSKLHTMEQDLAVRRAKENTKKVYLVQYSYQNLK